MESVMKRKKEKSQNTKLSVLILIAALLCAALIFSFCYFLDNKYQTSNTDPSKGWSPLRSSGIFTPAIFTLRKNSPPNRSSLRKQSLSASLAIFHLISPVIPLLERPHTAKS